MRSPAHDRSGPPRPGDPTSTRPAPPRGARADELSRLLSDERERHEEIAARQDLEEHLDGGDIDLRETAAALTEAIGALRDLNAGLYDAVVEDGDLERAVREVVGETDAREGPLVRVSVGPDSSGDHDRLVTRSVGELVRNVRKHAGASGCWVVVGREPDGGLVVTVGDDGRGLDPGAARSAADAGHLGLRTIARDVEAAGGSFGTRALSPGTEIELRLPADAA